MATRHYNVCRGLRRISLCHRYDYGYEFGIMLSYEYYCSGRGSLYLVGHRMVMQTNATAYPMLLSTFPRPLCMRSLRILTCLLTEISIVADDKSGTVSTWARPLESFALLSPQVADGGIGLT